MPLVILEGPDGSGKSTLAAKLLKGTGHPTLLVKRSGPPGDDETLTFQAKWILEQGHSILNIIADRHPLISEGIYRETVRKAGPSPWTPYDVAPILGGDRHILLVYCRPERATLFKTVHVEPQMLGVRDRLGALIDEYDRWMSILRSNGVEVWTYDFEMDDDGTIYNLVKGFWERSRG